MRTSFKVSAALVAFLSLSAASVHAQVNSNTIQATADVQTPINVTPLSDLDFGAVLPGVPKAVAVTDLTAGSFQVDGLASANVNLTFTLPTNLANGGNNLPIGSWTGEHTASAVPSGSNFTPSATPTPTVIGAGSSLYVFLGATVSPASSQAAGVYTGTVAMTVDYY
jgi:hypothetical protein